MTIKEIHLNKKEKISDKWESYLNYYDHLLYSISNKDINLLEIGVQNGGSLETWSLFFNNAKKIVGCDINPKCKDLSFEDKRISVVIGDANSIDARNEISIISSSFDLIIDDGSHRSDDIIKSFIYYSLHTTRGICIISCKYINIIWKCINTRATIICRNSAIWTR